MTSTAFLFFSSSTPSIYFCFCSLFSCFHSFFCFCLGFIFSSCSGLFLCVFCAFSSSVSSVSLVLLVFRSLPPTSSLFLILLFLLSLILLHLLLCLKLLLYFLLMFQYLRRLYGLQVKEQPKREVVWPIASFSSAFSSQLLRHSRPFFS